MKQVFISERDKAILGACAVGAVVGKKSIADMQALFNANRKLGIDGKQRDIEQASREPVPYELENAELTALKSMFEEGRGGLRSIQQVLEAVLDCNAHLEGAVPVDELKREKQKASKTETGETRKPTAVAL